MQSLYLRLCSVVFLPIFAFSQTNSSPQQGKDQVLQSQTVIRSTTKLVILDVIATDDHGNTVTDLKRDDFTVLEDGKPQKLIDFSFQRPSTTMQVAPRLAANVVSNVPHFAWASSWNIVLLDAINTDFSNRAYAQDMLIKYFEKSPVIEPTAVFALEGKLTLLHDFSTDTRALRDVLVHYKPKGPVHIADVYTAASAFTTSGSFQNSEQGIDVSLTAMLHLAHALANYPGRKNLVWVSDGFPLSLFPDVQMGSGAFAINDNTMVVEKITDELMKAQVAVYPIDASGVGVNDRFSARTAMESVAERTGGKTFYNRNDIDAGVRTSIEDGSTFYNMQYYPQNRNWNNKFRKIEVSVNRPHIHLQYRKGYYAVQPETGPKDNTAVAGDLGQALLLDSPAFSGVLFQASVAPPSESSQNKPVVSFGVDPHTISFQSGDDGLEHAKIGCVVWAYHSGDVTPLRFEGKTVNASLDPQVYQKVMSSYVPCHCPVDLKRGDYTLRVAVIDRTTNLIGATSLKLNVP